MYNKTMKYPELTLTASSYDTKVTIELPVDSTLDNVFDAFVAMVSALGYSEQGFKDIIMERAEIYTGEEKARTRYEEHLEKQVADLTAQMGGQTVYHHPV